MRLILFLLLCILMALPGCYSLRGFSIDSSLRTFYVADFRLTAANAPPAINQTFSEALRQKVSRESRLVFTDQDPDISFEGSISRYSVTSVSPERDALAAANRLEISVNIMFENHRNEKDNWTQTFSFFLDFAATANLLDIQDQLITDIFEQILEDVFNKAFTNW